MSDKWPQIPLCNICRPKQWPTISMKDLTTSGYPVYGANGRIGFYSEYTHERPTLLITCRGATCGTLNISEPFSYCNGNAMALDSLDDKLVDLRFLYHDLSFRRLDDVVSGSAQPQITRQGLEKVSIPLPPLPEQKRIAAILDKADELRRKRREAIAKLDTLTQSIFLDMFGDPVTNPKGWETCRLADAGTLDRGKSKHRPRNDPKLLGGPYPLIQTGDIANSGGQITEYMQTYSELGLQQSRMWPAGTLCITIAANIAKTAILTFDACFPDSVVGFHPNESTRTEYVQQWLSFLRENLEATAPESAQKNINLEILRKLTIPLPPISLQDEFVERFEVVLDRKRSFAKQADRLSQLFTSIQLEAFSGA